MTSNSRTKMVRSAASLMGSRGMNATSFSDVLADSGAPRGSIYHHFPSGKKQLAEEAVAWTSQQVLAHMDSCRGRTPVEVLAHFVALFRQVARTSSGASGCAVAGVTLDIDASDDELLGAARQVFRTWVGGLARQLETAGVPSKTASAVALTAVAGVEGALILCRAEGSAKPLDVVAGQLVRLVAAEP